MTNFGVEPFLDAFVELAPPPAPAPELRRGRSTPTLPRFSGFVFKIQANMDPTHRDRIAFVRVCSGRFSEGMKVKHVRTGRPFAMSRTVQFMAQERIDDRRGLRRRHPRRVRRRQPPHRRHARRGDGEPFEFEGMPRFSPEHFAQVTLTDPLKRKQLKKGLEQLSEEGAVQLFFDRERLERDPILGAVGVLQFEVIQHRLKSEYKVADPPAAAALQARPLGGGRVLRAANASCARAPRTCVVDAEGRPLVLFENDWALRKRSRNIRSCASSPPCSRRAAARVNEVSGAKRQYWLARRFLW